MNLDRSFCRNDTCPLRKTCDRSDLTLAQWVKEQPAGSYIRPISMTTFKPKADGTCDWYVSTEGKHHD